MSDRGHAGRLLFKAALKRVNSASPLGPSGLVSSIFSSAFVFLASEEGGSHLQNGLRPLHRFGFFCFFFSWQTASSVCSHREFCNQEDGCLHLILELLLNIINTLSYFI